MNKNNALFLTLFLITNVWLVHSSALSDMTKKTLFDACTALDYQQIKSILISFDNDKESCITLLNSQDKNGNTPLLLVLHALKQEETRSLTENMDSFDPYFEQKIQKREDNKLQLCSLILNIHQNLNIQNNELETALLYGIKESLFSVALIKLFLNAGADPLIPNTEQKTALDYSFHISTSYANRYKTIELLLSKINTLSKDAINKYVSNLERKEKNLDYCSSKIREQYRTQIRNLILLIAKKGLPKDPLKQNNIFSLLHNPFVKH